MRKWHIFKLRYFLCILFTNGLIKIGATSFSRNVISSNRRFAEMQFCRIVVLPKQKIAESHLTEASHGRIVELAKLHNAERHFSESLFSRTSFSRIVVQPNVIFTNRRLAERRFPATSFARTSFCRTLNRTPVYTFIQCACRRAAIKLIVVDILRHASKICAISNRVWVWTFLNMDTGRIRKVRNSRYRRFDLIVVFGKMEMGKLRSAKRRFEQTTFG